MVARLHRQICCWQSRFSRSSTTLVFIGRSSHPVDRRSHYDRPLAASRNGDWTSWIIFFLKGIIAQAKVNMRKAQTILKLHQEKRDRVVEGKRSRYAARPFEWIFQRPIFKTPDFIRAAQIPGADRPDNHLRTSRQRDAPRSRAYIETRTLQFHLLRTAEHRRRTRHILTQTE